LPFDRLMIRMIWVALPRGNAISIQ